MIIFTWNWRCSFHKLTNNNSNKNNTNTNYRWWSNDFEKYKFLFLRDNHIKTHAQNERTNQQPTINRTMRLPKTLNTQTQHNHPTTEKKRTRSNQPIHDWKHQTKPTNQKFFFFSLSLSLFFGTLFLFHISKNTKSWWFCNRVIYRYDDYYYYPPTMVK